MVDIYNDLNKSQGEAAANIHGASLIIAGAGSGKTRMLTYRIAHMLDSNIDEKNILALTFTNKAAKEMSERIRSLTKKELKKLTTTTFHSFGLGLLKRYIQYLGYKNNFTIYDTVDNISLIKQVILNLGYSLSDYNVNTLLSLFSDIKTQRVNNIHKEDSALNDIYNEWLMCQKTYNVVDFDDLILLPIKIFEKFPKVLEEVQDKYRYILVDEFQDTSILQYRFISIIANKYKNIAVVGDDDQSIYSWRGANYKNIQMFESDFPDLKEYRLEYNYRSSKTILEAANNLITNNSNRKDKMLKTNADLGSTIAIINPEDEDNEIFKIGKSIKNIAKETGLSFSDFAILVRTNTLMNTIETGLIEQGFKVKISGGKSFFDRKEIRDILSYLKFIINDDDTISLLRIINTPRRGIGRITIEKIKEYSEKKKISFFDALTNFAYAEDAPISQSIKKSLLDFTKLILSLQQDAENKDISKFIKSLIYDINYKTMLEEEYEDNDKIIDYKMRGLDFLTQRAERFEKYYSDRNLKDFLNLITIDSKDETDENEGAVNLLTMHASKGLEFNTVYIAGCEDNFIPSSRALEEKAENIEEERRLFYVAITRARKNLFISHCKTRKKREGDIYEPLCSRFLNEIPKELVSYDINEKLSLSKDDQLNLIQNMITKFNSK